MVARFLRRLIAPAVARDADRLIASHGGGAVYLARHVVLAAQEKRPDGHWCRVLAEVERRLKWAS